MALADEAEYATDADGYMPACVAAEIFRELRDIQFRFKKELDAADLSVLASIRGLCMFAFMCDEWEVVTVH